VKLLAAILTLASSSAAVAAEKKIWADSFLGRRAPEIVVEEWISAEPETRGKWVLVEFWATWCGPCVEAIPHLNEFHEEFGDKLAVIGISQQKRSVVERMKKPVISFHHGVDTRMRSYKAFGVKGIPHVVLIDPRGVVRWEGFPLLPGFKLTRQVLSDLLSGS
jgi:thiol-disulfide isomerase/thioredoxin